MINVCYPMPAVHERLLRSSDDFACPIDINFFQGRFVIDVEFLDLKICPPLNVSVTSYISLSVVELKVELDLRLMLKNRGTK